MGGQIPTCLLFPPARHQENEPEGSHLLTPVLVGLLPVRVWVRRLFRPLPRSRMSMSVWCGLSTVLPVVAGASLRAPLVPQPLPLFPPVL